MKKHITILLMLVLATSALAQHTEKVQELRQFLEEQGFKMRQYTKSNNPGNGFNWILSQSVRYPTPHANDNRSEDEAMSLKQRFDSIGRAYQRRIEPAVDSVRKVFLSLASESDDCDFFEYHKDGVDTVRLSLRFPPYPSGKAPSSSSCFQEWLKFTYTQNLNAENPFFRVNADLWYNNYVPWPDSNADSIFYFDKQVYDSIISSVVQPMLQQKRCSKYPLFWKWDADYDMLEKDVEWYSLREHRSRQISGSHWFFPKAYETEAIAALLRLDSLTEDYVDKKIRQGLIYNRLFIGRPWALDFYYHYDDTKHELLCGDLRRNQGLAHVVVRKEEDGIHLLSIISSGDNLWFPHGWTKLERWENGAATPLPEITSMPIPTFLYSNNSSLTVQKVEQTPDATLLTMRVKGRGYGSFNIQSSMHLVDERGKPVPINAVREFALDSTIILPESGTMDFTLVFPPLPKGTRIFDMIEGQHSNAFRIYGITDGKQKVEISARQAAIDPKEVTEASLRPDSVCIQGYFINYDRKTMPRLIRSDYNSDRLDFSDGSIYPICCRIDSLGYFSLSFLADHTIWNFLELVDANRLLPFLVHPGDTLLIDIDNYGQWNEKISYKSRQGNNVCEGLMHLGRDLIEQYYPGTANRPGLDAYINERDRFYKGKSRFYDYIVWKYRLTPWEAQLLTGNLTMNKTMNRLGFLNELHGQRSAAWFKLPENQRPDYNSFMSITTEDYAFLKAENWNDPSLAFQFYWKPFMDDYSPLNKFVFDTKRSMREPNGKWDAAQQELFRKKLLEDFPGMAPYLAEDFIRNKAPWAENIIRKRNEMTYTSDSHAVQRFIDTLLPECKSQLLQLLFIDRKNALKMDNWYNDRHNIIEDFSENQLLNFVLVIEGDSETAKIEQGLRWRFPKTQIHFVPTETFLDLCEGFRILYFPADVTINNKGEIYKTGLNSRDESQFRQNLKRKTGTM